MRVVVAAAAADSKSEKKKKTRRRLPVFSLSFSPSAYLSSLFLFVSSRDPPFVSGQAAPLYRCWLARAAGTLSLYLHKRERQKSFGRHIFFDSVLAASSSSSTNSLSFFSLPLSKDHGLPHPARPARAQAVQVQGRRVHVAR